jgi:hypothetical protein
MEDKEIVKVDDTFVQEIKASDNEQKFNLIQRYAKMYAASDLLPTTFKGNTANIIIALNAAESMNANPLMVMQNMYVVHGQPAFSSKFLIATVNACGRYTPLRYEFKGTEYTDDWSCRAYAFDANNFDTEKPIYGAWVSVKMAKDEGWYGKSGSKWQTMPELMLQYRAAAFFARTNCPEITMGMYTSEEYSDYSDVTTKGNIAQMAAQRALNRKNNGSK